MFRLTNVSGESAEAISDFIGLARDVMELEVVTHKLTHHVLDPLILNVPQVLLKYTLQSTCVSVYIYTFCSI